MSFPFSPYDFFGCLVAGFLVLCAIERAVGGSWIVGQDLKFSTAAFWVALAYVVGHVVANLASYVLEHKFLREGIGSPEVIPFTDEPQVPPPPARSLWREWWAAQLSPKAWWRWLFPLGLRRRVFPVYFKPLAAETRKRLLDKSSNEGFPTPCRALFDHCHAIVKREKAVNDRLTTFLNLYGFCRNVSMGALIAIPILIWGAFKDVTLSGWWFGGTVNTELLWWAAAAAGVAVGLLYRYLKFHRHYTHEVFLSYAEFPAPAKTERGK